AYGAIRTVDDYDWLQKHLASLSAHSESVFEEQWEITDAPLAYIDKLMSAVVGIEMVITRMIGKWKVSQNQPVSNKVSVVAGLRASQLPDSMEMAQLIESGINESS
ncbi:MAG: FMN-binding negative transcriptional regulator, partial [Gammaproteobacteria bacterium]|nr:FMN-binding negative transcriptional regulator [Gammaproteobacteria bacterium]